MSEDEVVLSWRTKKRCAAGQQPTQVKMRVRLQIAVVGAGVLESASEGRDTMVEEVHDRMLGLSKSRAQRRSMCFEDSFRVFL